jgi:hypothetical protein
VKSRSMEPFDGPVLTRYLQQRHNAEIDRQTGSHLRLRLPTGRTIGSLSHGPVPCSLMRDVARILEVSYSDLRSDMGYPVVSKSKPGSRLRSAPTPRRPVVKRKQVDAELRSIFRYLGSWAEAFDQRDRRENYLNGHSNAGHCAEALEALRQVSDSMRRALPFEAEQAS